MPFEVPGAGFSRAAGFQSHSVGARQIGISPGAERDAENLTKLFQALPTAIGRRVAYSAMLAGARAVRPAIKTSKEFTDRRGTLRAGIRRARRHKVVAGRTPAAYVSIRAPHAHFVEFGHGGPFPARPHPYVARALLEQASNIQKAIAQKFEQELIKEARKLQARYPTRG